VVLYERVITMLGEKMTPALRVAAKKAPLYVVARYFGTTKVRSPRRDWHCFNHNSGNAMGVNRPLRS